MTAILTNIRRLEELRDRGDITPAEFDRRRRAVLDAVEVVDTSFEPSPQRIPRTTGDRSPPKTSNALGLSIVVCLGVMGLSIGVTLLFLPDFNLALTVGVTILAALTVALLKHIDD